jgi:hypothetical protein
MADTMLSSGPVTGYRAESMDGSCALCSVWLTVPRSVGSAVLDTEVSASCTSTVSMPAEGPPRT